jgi:hypothetical protein
VDTGPYFDDSGNRLIEEGNRFREFYASVNFAPQWLLCNSQCHVQYFVVSII